MDENDQSALAEDEVGLPREMTIAECEPADAGAHQEGSKPPLR